MPESETHDIGAAIRWLIKHEEAMRTSAEVEQAIVDAFAGEVERFTARIGNEAYPVERLRIVRAAADAKNNAKRYAEEAKHARAILSSLSPAEPTGGEQ